MITYYHPFSTLYYQCPTLCWETKQLLYEVSTVLLQLLNRPIYLQPDVGDVVAGMHMFKLLNLPFTHGRMLAMVQLHELK